MSHVEHRATAPKSVSAAVLTVSDTRTLETDASGRAIADALTGAGHIVRDRRVVSDDPDRIRAQIAAWLDETDVDVVLTTGGTGLSSRDGTFEVVARLLEKRLDGFGELFRMLSYHEIGPAAMLSRACAGTARGKILIALPGSEAAVRLAMSKLVLPELGHLVREARK